MIDLKKRMYIIVGAFIALLASAAIISSIVLWYLVIHKPCNDFDELLAGDGNLSISQFVIVLPRNQKQVVLDDPTLLEYLTKAFRSAHSDYHDMGAFYEVYISLSSGVTRRCAIYVTRSNQSLTIIFPFDGLFPDENPVYRIPLEEPVPQELTDILDKLRGSSNFPVGNL